MRILQVVHQFVPHSIGGTEVYTEVLARELTRRGHRVSVFTRRHLDHVQHGELICADYGGLRVHEVLSRSDSSNAASLFFSLFMNRFVEDAFAEILDREEPDLVHFQHLKGLSINLVDEARRRGLATVWTMHDYWASCANCQLVMPDGGRCSGPRLWINCAECASSLLRVPLSRVAAPLIAILFAFRALKVKQAAEAVDLMVFPSSYVRDFFVGKGTPIERTRRIDPGIDKGSEVEQHSRNLGSELHLAYLGGIAWQKGIHVLVEALRSIDPRRVRLSIYGDHSAFPAYTQQLRASVGRARVTFLGQFEHDLLSEILADVDVVVVPSLWPETSCLVMQEALAAGVPVVASRIGALPERVRDGIDGLLFPPNDALALSRILSRMLDDPSILEDLRRGIGPVKSVRQHTDEIEAIYQEVTPVFDSGTGGFTGRSRSTSS